MNNKKKSRRGTLVIVSPILIGVLVLVVFTPLLPYTGYASYPLIIIILGYISAYFAIRLSTFFATIFLLIHKNFVSMHKTVAAIQKRRSINYFLDQKYSNKESLPKFLVYNIWYSVGITFLALRSSGAEDLSQLSLGDFKGFFLVYIALALIFSSAINTSLHLIQKKGIFFKNSNDGSIINLGSDLRRVINWSLGPMQVLFFLYTILTVTDYSLFRFLGIALIVCTVTSLVSYYVIKQRNALVPLFERFSNKVDKIILLEKTHTLVIDPASKASPKKDTVISKNPMFCPQCGTQTQVFYGKKYCFTCKNYI